MGTQAGSLTLALCRSDAGEGALPNTDTGLGCWRQPALRRTDVVTNREAASARLGSPLCRDPGRLTGCMEPGERKYALASYFGYKGREPAGYTPHAIRLGICVVEMGPCTATLVLPYRDELVGDPTRGIVFGGVITTLLDHGSGMATACALEVFTAIATIDLRIDYLRAAEPRCDLYGRTECYKLTRNVAFVRGIAWEHDSADPFATCHATMMLGAHRKGTVLVGDVDNESAVTPR